jgi:HK97 family phage major capsid protein
MRTIEQILAALQEIIAGATEEVDGTSTERPLNDEEIQRYEALEQELATVRRDAEFRTRHNAYRTPTRNDLHINSAGTEHATQRTDQERAFESYLRSGIPNSDLEFRAQSEGTGAAGGYLVPDAMVTRIVERMRAFGGISGEAEHVSTSSGNPLPWVTNDDTANEGEIVAENAQAAGGADLVFGPKALGAYKYESTGVDGEPLKVSWELAQDSAFDLESFVDRKLAERIHRKQAKHWATGTGVGQPQGLLTGGTTGITIASNAVGMTFANIVGATHVPDIAYREDGESVWVMNDASVALLEGLLDANNRPLLGEANDSVAGKPVRTLRGYRIVIDNSMPVFGAGAKAAVFGNVKRGYIIRDVKEVTLIVLRELYARTGQIGYLAWARADGMVQDGNAFTVITSAA